MVAKLYVDNIINKGIVPCYTDEFGDYLIELFYNYCFEINIKNGELTHFFNLFEMIMQNKSCFTINEYSLKYLDWNFPYYDEYDYETKYEKAQTLILKFKRELIENKLYGVGYYLFKDDDCQYYGVVDTYEPEYTKIIYELFIKFVPLENHELENINNLNEHILIMKYAISTNNNITVL
jgi:hypothetical protein